MKERFIDRKEFFGILITLSVPIVLQNLISTSVNLIDTLMVGQLGDTAVAAVGLGNQIFFILNLFLFGLCSGAAIFIAQFWGKKDIKGIHDTLGMAIMMSIPLALIIAVLAILQPELLLSAFTDDKELLAAGGEYLPIAAVSYVFMAVSMQFSFALRSVECVRYPFYSTSIALVFNVVFNYIFIFGLGPIPEMGVFGAGLATTLARILETGLMVGFAYGRKTPVAIPITSLYRFDKSYMPKFLKVASPVLITEALWGLGSTAYFAIYGRMGTAIVAAVNISKTIENFCLVFFWSVAGAASISIGKAIGQQEPNRAHKLANSFFVFSLCMGVVLGSILYFVAPGVLTLFNVSAEVIATSIIYINLFCVFVIFRGTAPMLTVGILRSGGDTTFTFLIDIIPLWLICLPLAWYTGIKLHLPVQWVFIISMMYDVIRLVPALIRVQAPGKKWIKNLVHDNASK